MGCCHRESNFLKKEWPQTELDALLGAELSRRRVLLPVWHRVTEKDVAIKSPILASRLAIDTSKGLDVVCQAILRAVRRREFEGFTDGDSTHANSKRYFGNSRTGESEAYPDGSLSLQEFWFNRSSSHLRRMLQSNQAHFGRIGQYMLKDLVGIGGSGAVFRASHGLFSRTVALKLFFSSS